MGYGYAKHEDARKAAIIDYLLAHGDLLPADLWAQVSDVRAAPDTDTTSLVAVRAVIRPQIEVLPERLTALETLPPRYNAQPAEPSSGIDPAADPSVRRLL